MNRSDMQSATSLSDRELERYSRQIRFACMGLGGQAHLKAARVAIIGCGALGATIAELLARAGVGFMRLADRDFVDLSNLPRQSLYDETHVKRGLPKAIAASERLQQINSALTIETRVETVDATNIERLISGVDLVMDGTDNFPTRFLLNDAAHKLSVPWIFGSALASRGMMMVVRPGHTACLRCVLDEPPAPGVVPTCDQEGVLSVAVHVTSSLQVTEALKILTGQAESCESHLVEYDLWIGRFSRRGVQQLRGKGHCRTCEQHSYDFLAGALEPPRALAGRDGIEIPAPRPQTAAAGVDFTRLARHLEKNGQLVLVNPHLLRCRINGATISLFADGRAIVQGAGDAASAQALVANLLATQSNSH